MFGMVSIDFLVESVSAIALDHLDFVLARV